MSRLQAGRRLLIAVAAGVLLSLALLEGYVIASLADLEETQRRLESLGDSLRSVTPSEARLLDLERRVEDAEGELSHAARAARVPEVIALRRWARRLDSELLMNRRRIVRHEHLIDSLRDEISSRDSIHQNMAAQP